MLLLPIINFIRVRVDTTVRAFGDQGELILAGGTVGYGVYDIFAIQQLFSKKTNLKYSFFA